MNLLLPQYGRELLLYGSKRNEVLTLAEIERYGIDNFGDADYVHIYGMPPREWYRLGIRLLGRTVVECTRDALADRIGLDVASIARRLPTNRWMIIDPFAGSCNTLFWILHHLPNSAGIASELDQQVFELSCRNLALLGRKVELVHGDYVGFLKERLLTEDRGIVAFVAPPWGTALDEIEGLDLSRTTPPISEVLDRIICHFPSHKLLLAVQVYEKLSAPSLAEVQARLDWSELRTYDLNEKGRNHGILMGAKGWAP
jgi:hypothetical protein